MSIVGILVMLMQWNKWKLIDIFPCIIVVVTSMWKFIFIHQHKAMLISISSRNWIFIHLWTIFIIKYIPWNIFQENDTVTKIQSRWKLELLKDTPKIDPVIMAPHCSYVTPDNGGCIVFGLLTCCHHAGKGNTVHLFGETSHDWYMCMGHFGNHTPRPPKR